MHFALVPFRTVFGALLTRLSVCRWHERVMYLHQSQRSSGSLPARDGKPEEMGEFLWEGVISEKQAVASKNERQR
jgi:hypothetical protein